MRILKNPALYLCVAALLCAVAFLLVYSGEVLLNAPSKEEYPVRGVDVSSYQGTILWDQLHDDADFAFIKATEGSSHTDSRFAENLAGAQAAGIPAGAYHFFSYDSSGAAQAEHFISVVPQGMRLPPVLDVEFYGDKEQYPPPKEEAVRELTAMVQRLTEHYGTAPIIYATEKSYRMFIEGEFPMCDIWIRNVITTPTVSDGRAWTFWQYTNRERLQGCPDGAGFVDMNVFSGSREAFEEYLLY